MSTVSAVSTRNAKSDPPVPPGPVRFPPESTPEAVRPPSGNPRFPAIDGLRAFAALTVVVFHADQLTGAQNTVPGRFFAHGDIGVTVFFLITGFLLYRPFFAAAIGDAPLTATSLFYWRRLVRIVPGYWVALIVLAPLLVYAHPAGIPNFLFIQVYRPGEWSRSGIGPAWSICVEMSFYLLLPLYAKGLARICRGLSRQGRQRLELRVLATLALASLAFRVLLPHVLPNQPSRPFYLDPLPGTLMWFCAGMALAVISVEPSGWGTRLHRLAARPWACWTLAGALYGATLVTTDYNEQSSVIFVVYCAAATLLLMPLVLRDFHRFAGGRILHARPAAWVGLVSYGIYLYHFPIMTHLHPHTGSTVGNFALLAVVGAAIAITCGALSYYIVERPALSLKNTATFARLKQAVHPA